MWEYGLAGNMHFRFLHLIKQVLKSTRYTTGGRCSVSAQASGAASAVLSHAGRRDASPTPSRGSAAGNAVVPDGPLPCSTGVPPVIVPTGGRCSVSAQASGAESAVLSHAGRRDASPTPSRRSAASPLDARLSSLDSSPSSATRHSRFAALTSPTLSTILHPHEHGQNSFDSRSSSDRAAQGSRHCGEPRSGLSRTGGRPHEAAHDQAGRSRPPHGTEHQDRRFQGRDDQVDVSLLDRTDHSHRCAHQTPLTPAQGADGLQACSTGVVRPWSAKLTPPGPPVIVPTGGRCSVSAQAPGAGSAVLSQAGRRDASPTPSRRFAASVLDARLSSLDSSPSSVTRHSRSAASDLLSFRRSAATRHQLPVTRHRRAAASYHE